MNLTKQAILCISTIILIGLSGCARYRALPLNRLTPKILPNAQDRCISFEYRIFTRDDCTLYLDRNVISKGYQPVQITLNNNTNRYLSLSLMNFSFPCVPVEAIARKVHTSTMKRAVSYGVAGLFIWPFLIPAVVDGIGSSEANEELDADFTRKALREDQIINPFHMINGLIFVPIEYFSPQFSLTLIDRETQKLFMLDTAKTILKI
ncbi:MAG: hypothetical protein WA432_01905 [Candidatus Babeliaceae bacterium]